MDANQRLKALGIDDDLSTGHSSVAYSEAGTVATNATNISGGTKLIAFPADHGMNRDSYASNNTLDQNLALNQYNQIKLNGQGRVMDPKEAKDLNAKDMLITNEIFLDRHKKEGLELQIHKAEKKLRCIGAAMVIVLILAIGFFSFAFLA